jgi:hypothetical protein
MGITYLKMNGAPPTKRKSSHLLACSYCGVLIKEKSETGYNYRVFCSDECFNSWVKYGHEKLNTPIDDIKICSQCNEQIGQDDYIIYEDKSYCSEKCLDCYIELDWLNKCKSGEISFLDIPKEIRDKEHNIKKYKSVSKTCPICNTIFYTSSSFGEQSRVYCSEKCWKIGMKPFFDKHAILNSGWRNKNWRGGISNGKYCHKFNNNLKTRVRSFFENKCILCGKSQDENGRSLHVHHVNYNKNACCDSSKVMLVPLCNECHGMTNQNREYWEDYFEGILKNQYDYKCYYTKEEHSS